MEHKILLALLEHSVYLQYRPHVKLSDIANSWLQTIDLWFTTHSTNLTVEDLYELHTARFPVATKNQKELIDIFYARLTETSVNKEVMGELLNTKAIQDKCLDLAEKLSNIASGNSSSSFSEVLATAVKNIDTTGSPDYTPEDITADTMLEASEAQSKWGFNLPVWAEYIGGIGPGVFILFAARPNAAKTLACISSCFAPKGWLEQGAKIVYLGNEEPIHRTKHRAICSHFGVDYKSTKQDHNKFRACVNQFDSTYKDKAIFLYKSGMYYHEVDSLLEAHKPDILILDQIDKLTVKGDAPSHEKMRVIYTNVRNYAVKHSCAIVGVSQASEAAAGKKFFGFDALEHSKTGKAAELDAIICIGMEELPEDNNIRYFKLPKNKLTGLEKSGSFLINKEQSRLLV